MANTPGGFRDPAGRGTSRTIGYIVAAVIVLLLLGWLLGLFGDDDAGEVETEGTATTEEALEDAAEEAEDAAD